MGVLASGNSDVRNVVSHVVTEVVANQDGTCGGGAGHGQEGEADKGLKGKNQSHWNISLTVLTPEL